MLTYEDGTVANLGVSWELPEFWPAYVATMDFELFGREGTVSVKDDHRDVLHGLPQADPFAIHAGRHHERRHARFVHAGGLGAR